MSVDLSGKRVLVTGGTGFIGGRLIERLILQCNAEVRALVRGYSHAARIARFPVQMALGDVSDRAAVERAAEGCDLIFHCAYGSSGGADKQREVTVGGTQNVIDAGTKHGASRVVHVSTINVYGETPDGAVDETAPRQYFGDSYSDTKLDAEKVALDAAEKSGAPVTVVQPTVVYGPFGPAWTVRILGEIKGGRIILVDGGSGLCNAVYVDDVVTGMLLAGTRDEAVGQAFLLSGPEPVTWRDYYGGYERMLGVEGTAPMSMAAAEEIWKTFKKKKSLLSEGLDILRKEAPVRQRVGGTVEVTALKSVARALMPKPLRQSLRERLKPTAAPAAAAAAPAAEPARPIHPMPPSALKVHASKTRFSIDKARRLLGYEPAFSFDAGMRMTERWARWANLAPAGD